MQSLILRTANGYVVLWIKMRKYVVCFLFLFPCGLQICNCFTYDKVGESYYFIGNGHSEDVFFDYFDARRSCWHNDGELVSVETADEMIQLEHYIRSKGYANGSIFATSGHSYDSEYPFKWEALDQVLTYKKWLSGEEPLADCNLSLQLIDSELYMTRTWGYNQYYICEKSTIWNYLQASFRQFGLRALIISLLPSFIILALLKLIQKYRLSYQQLKIREKNKFDFV